MNLSTATLDSIAVSYNVASCEAIRERAPYALIADQTMPIWAHFFGAERLPLILSDLGARVRLAMNDIVDACVMNPHALKDQIEREDLSEYVGTMSRFGLSPRELTAAMRLADVRLDWIDWEISCEFAAEARAEARLSGGY